MTKKVMQDLLMKNPIKISLICVVTTVLLLGILFYLSPMSEPIYRSSFDRNLEKEIAIKETNSQSIVKGVWYIAGYTNHVVYIGNQNFPYHLIQYNIAKKDTKNIYLRLVDIDSVLEPKRFRTKVDSPTFYMINGVMPIILKGDTKSWRAKRFMPDSGYYFTDALRITDASFALRSYSLSEKSYEIAKFNPSEKPSFAFKKNILEKQIDGMFCVDGKMTFNKTKNEIIYLYTYRNQYLVIDTNFNIIYKGNTIDTFKTAPINVYTDKKTGTSVLSTLPNIINRGVCTHNENIYIQSNLMAKNENANNFINNSVIDSYSIKDNKYLFSFYIPNSKHQPIIDYQVVDNNLIAIFDEKIITYDISNLLKPNKPAENRNNK